MIGGLFETSLVDGDYHSTIEVYICDTIVRVNKDIWNVKDMGRTQFMLMYRDRLEATNRIM